MSVSLIQQIRFIATWKTKIDKRVISKVIFPSIVNERSFQDWNNIVLPIPAVCSTSNGISKIIEVNYMAVFNFNPSGMSVSKDLIIPIVIGTIPFRENYGVSLGNDDSSAPPPYSYEGCMFGPNTTKLSNEDDEKGEYYENDSNTYRPLYPVYKDFSMDNSKF